MRKVLALLLVFTLLVIQPAEAYRVGLKKFGHNYFGSGVLGSVTISTSPVDVTWSGTGNQPQILEYDNLTINNASWLRLFSRRGTIVLVKNDLTLTGTAALTSHCDASTSAPGEGIFNRAFVDAGGAKGLTTVVFTPAAGGTGGAAATTGSNPGGTLAGGTGGGGAGGAVNGSGFSSGAGAGGTCWGGGSGGGAGGNNGNGSAGAADCGAGGNAGALSGGNRGHGGGSGNGGGTGTSTGAGSGNTGTVTNGGYLEIWVGGNLTLSASCTIACPGQAGGNASGGGASTNTISGGGGSGGGKLANIYYAGTLTNSGATLAVGGGAGGVASGSSGSLVTGGLGGAGTTCTITKVSKR